MNNRAVRFEVQLSVSENGRNKPEYTIESDLNGEISLKDFLEFTRSVLIVTADEALKEEQAAGFDKNPILYVDGRKNKPVSAVHPLGQIEFTARENVSAIVLETYEALLYRSKVLTGHYKSNHFVFLNGRQVATDMSSLVSWLASSPEFKESDLVRFVNIVPYARKLERYGITAQRSEVRRKDSSRRKDKPSGKLVHRPNGTYYLTTRAIRAKYKRNSTIKFEFISGGSLGIAGSFKGGRKGKNSSGRPYLYPSIVISIKERGII